MTAFKSAVSKLASRTENEIDALYARLDSGEIDQDTFIELAAQVIARARAQGVSLADMALTAEAMRQLGGVEVPLGLTPPENDYDRLHESVRTVLDERPDYVDDRERLRESQRARITRLGRDAPAEASIWAMGLAMVARQVKGWTRETDQNPCPMCSNLADGVVRSPSVTMKRHTGCSCTQRVIF